MNTAEASISGQKNQSQQSERVQRIGQRGDAPLVAILLNLEVEVNGRGEAFLLRAWEYCIARLHVTGAYSSPFHLGDSGSVASASELDTFT
jgi:hypothetical protein